MQGTAQLPSGVDQRDDEQLVAIRQAVLNDVEHAVGNLLQRMHHAARAVRNGSEAHGERLQSALGDLERLLELLFDYVSPVVVQVRPIDAGQVVESLAAQLRGHGAADVALGPVAEVQVLGDLRALSRSFQLLAQGCAREWGAAGLVAIDVVHDVDGGRVELALRTTGELTAPATMPHALAVAVAARLLELQGGELRQRPEAACPCAVVLATAG